MRLAWILCTFLAILTSVVNGKLLELIRDVELDGKVCRASDLLLVSFSPSRIFCTGLCHALGACASLFYSTSNRMCFVCDKAYLPDAELTSVKGTQYAHDPDLAPTTTTSTTSTSTTSTSTTSTSTSTSTSTTITSTSTSTSTSTTSTSTTSTSTTTPTTSTSTSTSTTSTSTTSTPTTPSPWKYYQGSYYRVSDTETNYDNAQEICQGYGGNLARISSAGENTFIGNMATAVLGNKYKVYLGAHDKQRGGNWKWEDDGTPLSGYHNWRGGKAHTVRGQDCLGFVENYEWMDVYCSMNRRFICEKPA